MEMLSEVIKITDERFEIFEKFLNEWPEKNQNLSEFDITFRQEMVKMIRNRMKSLTYEAAMEHVKTERDRKPKNWKVGLMKGVKLLKNSYTEIYAKMWSIDRKYKKGVDNHAR